MPLSVVNTHYHFDHIGGNHEFEEIAIWRQGSYTTQDFVGAEMRVWRPDATLVSSPSLTLEEVLAPELDLRLAGPGRHQGGLGLGRGRDEGSRWRGGDGRGLLEPLDPFLKSAQLLLQEIQLRG